MTIKLLKKKLIANRNVPDLSIWFDFDSVSLCDFLCMGWFLISILYSIFYPPWLFSSFKK